MLTLVLRPEKATTTTHPDPRLYHAIVHHRLVVPVVRLVVRFRRRFFFVLTIVLPAVTVTVATTTATA